MKLFLYLLVLFIVDLVVLKILRSSFLKDQKDRNFISSGIITGVVIGSIFSIVSGTTPLGDALPNIGLGIHMVTGAVFGILSAFIWKKE